MQASSSTIAGTVPAAPLASPAASPPAAGAHDLWDRACRLLRTRLSDGNFTIWFARTRPLELRDDLFLLSVPNPFTKEWIEDRLLDQLVDAVRAVAGRDLEVVLVAGDAYSDNLPEPEPPLPPAAPRTNAPPADDGFQFHPRYTFDSFVIGASNHFAHAATLAVAEAVAENYNPLFIYGGAGLGKTHLLHALGHHVRECRPDLVVRYLTTEQFTNEFILALRRRTIPEFHHRYRAVDLLMMDDIQFLEGKERMQEEFFHTFNALHPRSQIVLTSDRAPKMLSTLEERLLTRFEWGLTTDIQPPDLETRLAILHKKAEADGFQVPLDVMSYIAERIQTNIRELEGALIRVAAYASLTHCDITLELAHNVLQALFPSAEARVTADLVIRTTAHYFDVTPEQITSASRARPLVNARQVAMYLCRELTDLSLPGIGQRFGGRDHTTVLHATKKIAGNMQRDHHLYDQIQELTSRIRQQAAGA